MACIMHCTHLDFHDKQEFVATGYEKRGLEIWENPKFLIFKDSQLVAQVRVVEIGGGGGIRQLPPH